VSGRIRYMRSRYQTASTRQQLHQEGKEEVEMANGIPDVTVPH
jgi:hypothetical protein